MNRGGSSSEFSGVSRSRNYWYTENTDHRNSEMSQRREVSKTDSTIFMWIKNTYPGYHCLLTLSMPSNPILDVHTTETHTCMCTQRHTHDCSRSHCLEQPQAEATTCPPSDSRMASLWCVRSSDGKLEANESSPSPATHNNRDKSHGQNDE